MQLSHLVKQRGFTLTELMITLAVAAILLAAAVPSGVGWIQQSRVNQSSHLLTQAHGMARALALRNPQANSQAKAAGWKLTAERLLLVCEGDPLASTCAPGGAQVRWQAQLHNSLHFAVPVNTNWPQSFNAHGISTGALSLRITHGSKYADLDLQ